MRISIEKISELMYLAVLGSLILDVGGAFGLKYVVSTFLLLWVLVLMTKTGIRRGLATEFGVLLYFAFSACYSAFRGIEISDIYGQLSFVIYFSLLFVVLYIPRNPAADLFRRTMIFGSIIVIGTFISIFFFPVSAVAWKTLGDTYRMGYLGVQTIGGEVFPTVYYRWSMWLIPAFIISLGTRWYATLLIGMAALMTLSTAVVVFTLLGTALSVLVLYRKRTYNLKSTGIAAALVVVVLAISEMNYSVFALLYESVLSKLSPDSFSTSVKLGHIEGVSQAMQTSVSNILFGMGAGSEFYSPGFGRYTINIEVSHFNFVRQFGLIGGAVFFGYVLYVIVTGFNTDALGKRWSIALLMLFVAAGTNPLLMSPIFIVLLVTVRAYTARFYSEESHE